MPTKTTAFGKRNLVLDARPDRLDLRDLVYQAPLGNLPPVYPSEQAIGKILPAYLKNELILDQSAEGACTGFGLAAVVNYLLWLDAFRAGQSFAKNDLVSPRMFYHLARFYDEWEGEDYEGSSCRGALKGWHRHDVCLETLWPYKKGKFVRPKAGWDEDALTRPLGVYYRINKDSVVDMQAAIKEVGAIYVSSQVHAGWQLGASKKDIKTHADLPLIETSENMLGGHAFAIVGYNRHGFVVQNSWGAGWGSQGFAVLTYADWVNYGSDAWAVSMGVPVVHPATQKPARAGLLRRGNLPASISLLGFDGASDPLAKRSDVWNSGQAYQHTLVTGNNGLIINRLPQLEDAADAVKYLGYEQPLKWFKKQPGDGKWRLAIYAHGGLNSEADSIQRIRVLGPNFKNNGIYPLFVTWKSGWSEILANMLEDALKGIFGAAGLPQQGLGDAFIEASDRALESACRYIAARGLWSEMKENVERSADAGGGLSAMAKQINDLAEASGGKLEVHMIGHSAGSFVTGRLLSELANRQLNTASCTLFAPACDLSFALRHYRAALDKGNLASAQFKIHALSDSLELDDTVGPYRKSLLYLVSRALERVHKTPLLGMEKAFASNEPIEELWNKDHTIQEDVREWRNFYATTAQGALAVLKDKQVNTGTRSINRLLKNAIPKLRATKCRIS